MFTGIVEVVGVVSSLIEHDTSSTGGNGCSLTISGAESILGDCNLGDSIAVNGTCLTVTEFDKDSFKVGISPETLRRTSLGDLKEGSPVNLERAMAAHVRFGGHFVQGHVDTTAEILSITPDGNALTFRFRPHDDSLMKYIIEKGYVTLDGTSLTVVEVNDEEKWFSIMMVAYTQEKVIMPTKKVGQKVNVEVDMIGKLVEKQVAAAVGDLENNGVLETMIKRVLAKQQA